MIKVILKPEKGIQIDSTKKYLFDPSIVQQYVDASEENAVKAENSAKEAQQVFDYLVVYTDNAKTDIDNKIEQGKSDIEGTKNTAINTINSTVAQAKTDINTAVSDAESTISTIVSDAEGSITNIAVTEANKAIANAAQEATDTATANLNSYVDGTVKPSLQTYVDQAQSDANSAATSMEQAALSATAASNYANNASADADNAAESAGLAANSATDSEHYSEDSRIWAEGTDSEVQGLGGVHSSKVWSEIVEGAITTIEGAVGDIGFAPLGIDESKNKRRYLNGQVISQTQFATFTDKVKAAVALYPSLSATEANWQAEVTNSKLGQCGKFVIDNTVGTIRLPKVVNIQGLADLSLMGGIKAESLPNITGTAGLDPTAGLLINTGTPTGVFYKGDAKNTRPSGSDDSRARDLGFDASLSSSTYQDNAPVQQEAIQYPYFIQVATGSEESVDVSTEIQLNNPFSLLDYKWSEYELSNASWLISNGSFHSGATYPAVYELLLKIKNGTETKDGVSVKLSTEAYTDTDFVLNTANTTFRLPVKVKLASGNASQGLYLYFYVGETIQDANIIAAASVLTKVANCIDRTVASDRETVVGWGMPDYSARIQISSFPYTVMFKGWLVGQTSQATENYIYVNDFMVAHAYNNYSQVQIPVDIGDVVTITGSAYIHICPMKGAK